MSRTIRTCNWVKCPRFNNKNYDGKLKMYTMIDSGDGIMHNTNKKFTKRIYNKKHRKLALKQICSEIKSNEN
jgi:hypothetical protein